MLWLGAGGYRCGLGCAWLVLAAQDASRSHDHLRYPGVSHSRTPVGHLSSPDPLGWVWALCLIQWFHPCAGHPSPPSLHPSIRNYIYSSQFTSHLLTPNSPLYLSGKFHIFYLLEQALPPEPWASSVAFNRETSQPRYEWRWEWGRGRVQ